MRTYSLIKMLVTEKRTKKQVKDNDKYYIVYILTNFCLLDLTWLFMNMSYRLENVSI